jgi:Methylamine utilisation protein MauE
MLRRMIVSGCFGVVSVMLATSAYQHLDNSYFFLSTIYSYQIVGETTGRYLATLLPVFQLTIVIAILFDKRARKTASLLSTILFLLFLSAQISTLARGLKISCGCFGSSDETLIGVKSIGIAVSGLVCSAIGFWLSRDRIPETTS